MSVLEIILLTVLFTMPFYQWSQNAKTKQAAIAGKVTKIQLYKETIIFLWAPTILLFGIIWLEPLSFIDLGVPLQATSAELYGALIVLSIVGYFALSYKSMTKNEQTRLKVKEQMASLSWFMPHTKAQLNWFTYGVSVSAGICEELIFRGYLLHLLSGYMAMPAAVATSCILFGLYHSYQGLQGIIKTSIMGLIFALLYLWTGSLVVAIVLHIVVDVYAGALFYVANKGQYPSEQSRAA